MQRPISLPTTLAITALAAVPLTGAFTAAAGAVGYEPVPGVPSGAPPSPEPAGLPNPVVPSSPSNVPVSTVAPPAEADAASLPFTGLEAGLVVGAGVLLLGAGGVLRLATRRDPDAR
jgi:hypothetical protein